MSANFGHSIDIGGDAVFAGQQQLDWAPLIAFAEEHNNDVAGFEQATGIAVPEPSSLGILAIAAMGLKRRNRR